MEEQEELIQVTCPHCHLSTEMSKDASSLLCPGCLKTIPNPLAEEKILSLELKTDGDKTFPVEKKSTSVSTGSETESTANITERESTANITSTSSRKKMNPQKKLNDPSLSVWEKLTEGYEAKLTDPDSIVKLNYYNKHQELIKKVIDPHKIFSVNRATKLGQEANIKQSSYTVVSRLLESLYIDGFLQRETIRCGNRHPAQVYYTERCTQEEYDRYTRKLREQEEQTNHLTKKINSQNLSNDKLNEIKEKSKMIWRAQKEASKELKEEETRRLEEERKKRIERAAITVVKKKQENSSWYDQLSDKQKKYVAGAREKIKREYLENKKSLGERKALALANKKKRELKEWCEVNFLYNHQESEEK